jgi:hypothetical protein
MTTTTATATATARPKAPAERTFVVAVTLLSLAAIAQLFAVVIALAPQIDLASIGHSLAPRATSAPAAAPAAPAAVTAENAQQANALMNEAEQFRTEGNFRGALEAVTEADRLVPGKPGLMLQMAHDYVQLNKVPEAIAVLNRIVALPPSSDPTDAAYQEKARAAIAQLGGTVAPASAAPATAAAPAAPASPADDVGIPIGSVMGIVSADMVNGEPGQKNLRIATKAGRGQQIDGQKFVATVDFYEQDDHGQLQHNDAPQVTEWLSYPINWANGDPELFQTKYRMPPADRGDLPPLQYYGYVVGIYYNGELQDQRAEPVSLLDKFPPPIHKPLPTE